MRISDWSSDVCSSDLLKCGRSVFIIRQKKYALVCHVFCEGGVFKCALVSRVQCIDNVLWRAFWRVQAVPCRYLESWYCAFFHGGDIGELGHAVGRSQTKCAHLASARLRQGCICLYEHGI